MGGVGGCGRGGSGVGEFKGGARREVGGKSKGEIRRVVGGSGEARKERKVENGNGDFGTEEKRVSLWLFLVVLGLRLVLKFQ